MTPPFLSYFLKFDRVATVSAFADGVVTRKSDDWIVFVWDLSELRNGGS
jgi:hypothetical protein